MEKQSPLQSFGLMMAATMGEQRMKGDHRNHHQTEGHRPALRQRGNDCDGLRAVRLCGDALLGFAVVSFGDVWTIRRLECWTMTTDYDYDLVVDRREFW